MNDWKKKAVLGFAGAAALGAFGFAATTSASADTVKTVQSGNTLWSISQTTGQSVDNLKNINHLTSDVIYVGQRLTINGSTAKTPAATSTPAKATTDTVKIVQSGDTLWSISQTTGQSVDNLKSINHLTSDVIYVGQRLTISGATAKTPATTTQTQQTTQAPVQKTSTQTQAPAQQTSTPAQPTTQAPVQKTSTPAQATKSPTQSTTTHAATPAANDSSAKSWIAQHESGGSYTAQNGQYYGKYQLSASYLNGDYSAANQDRVADAYVNARYGSWDNAKQHWVTAGWY